VKGRPKQGKTGRALFPYSVSHGGDLGGGAVGRAMDGFSGRRVAKGVKGGRQLLPGTKGPVYLQTDSADKGRRNGWGPRVD